MLHDRSVWPACLIVLRAGRDHSVGQLGCPFSSLSEGLVEDDLLGAGLDGLVPDGLNLCLGVVLEAVYRYDDRDTRLG